MSASSALSAIDSGAGASTQPMTMKPLMLRVMEKSELRKNENEWLICLGSFEAVV
jgi:hypothetical protein